MAENELLPESIQSKLKTRFIGQKILYFPKLDSTMEIAKREALWGSGAGTVIIAEEQTAGKGRLQRSWISPKGGIAISIILRPNLNNLPYMIMLASLAVLDTVKQITGLKPQIKWPNDILIGEKKVSGILIENDIRDNVLKYTIIGIGINVNFHVSNYPEIAKIATSLADELKREVSKLEVLTCLLTEMDRGYQELTQGKLIWERWRDHLVTLGQKVQVQMGSHIYTGTAETVTQDGSLMLRQQEGGLIKIIAGDVTLQ
jgi:BirA family biotin operon repressor/biotin-[acetyl-CoA-carboxylase] ligase